MNRRSFLQGASALPLAAAFSAEPLAEMLKRLAGQPLSGSMWAYLWDLADEGYDTPLARMKENGLTAVSLACAYHAGKFLAPHNPVRKVVFLEDGTVYFKPTPGFYGKIHPLVNSLVQQGHSLTEVRKHAASAGMQTNAWVVCCHNTPLGTKFPEIACETAFGDKLYHSLCPSNPDVRQYIGALVKDLASQGVARIELEALQFQGYTHGYHHEREGIPLTGPMRFLLGLCFCASCTTNAKRARVDIDLVKKFTKTTLEAEFATPGSGNDYKSVDDFPPELFQPFLQWRMSVVASLARELAESVRGTDVRLRPLVSIDPAARVMVGINPKAIADTTGGILVPGYVKDGNVLREPLRQLQSLVGDKEIVTGFQVGLPESGGKKEFLDRMHVARELGITQFNFYNYGFIPLANLEWIKEGMEQ